MLLCFLSAELEQQPGCQGCGGVLSPESLRNQALMRKKGYADVITRSVGVEVSTAVDGRSRVCDSCPERSLLAGIDTAGRILGICACDSRSRGLTASL